MNYILYRIIGNFVCKISITDDSITHFVLGTAFTKEGTNTPFLNSLIKTIPLKDMVDCGKSVVDDAVNFLMRKKLEKTSRR